MFAGTESKIIANGALMGLHSNEILAKGEGMSALEGNQKLSGPQMEKIESRFGAITVDKAKALLFPVGILGMPDKHHFVLTDFPNAKLKQFKLLQSLDDHSLSFITLPVEKRNNIIDAADVETACSDMEIPSDEVGMLLIVSVHRGMTSVQLSVNARAPIFVDSERRAAAQYVFTSSKYRVQHFITGDKEKNANAE